MASFLDFGVEDQDLRTEIHERSNSTFEPRSGEPQMQLSRLFQTGDTPATRVMSIEQNLAVCDTSQLKSLKAEPNVHFQVFIIRQKRSWTSLDISRELFENFIVIFAVFLPIWRCIFTFGKKSEEDECEFPGFRSSGPSRIIGKQSIESAYVIRRVELHHRELGEGQSPWSIRQSAIYHRYSEQERGQEHPCASGRFQSTALLVSPSVAVDDRIARLLQLALVEEEAVNPCVLHSLIVADSVKGWMGYISWLEKHIKEVSVRITFADLQAKKDEPGERFTFNVYDRQGLEVTEDLVIDLQTILSTLRNTIEGIKGYCRKCCRMSSHSVECACIAALDEFDGYINEVNLCIERATILKERVVSTAHLLSDLLRYEDQEALKDLNKQSQEENRLMRLLAEKSTKDAEAVKVLTIIGLVYLPTTFVAKNFFSTEFVRTDESGKMSVTANTWLLAAIALPLTVLTITTWWLCVQYKSSHVSLKSLKSTLEGFGGWWSLRRRRSQPRAPDTENPEFQSNSRGSFHGITWPARRKMLRDD